MYAWERSLHDLLPFQYVCNRGDKVHDRNSGNYDYGGYYSPEHAPPSIGASYCHQYDLHGEQPCLYEQNAGYAHEYMYPSLMSVSASVLPTSTSCNSPPDCLPGCPSAEPPTFLQMDMLKCSHALAIDNKKRKWSFMARDACASEIDDPDDDNGNDNDGTDDNDDGSDVIKLGDDAFKQRTRQNHSEIEKRRRDKMNTYIAKLSSMLPKCRTMNRKLDKLTILRMVVHHVKALKSTGNSSRQYNKTSPHILEDELKQLTLQAADGFIFVVSCNRGEILYTSKLIKDTLSYNEFDLIGQSLFDIIHPHDITKVKEQLSSAHRGSRESLTDVKTTSHTKTESPTNAMNVCSGARRSFYCRMKCLTKIEGDAIKIEECLRLRAIGEKKQYTIIHCTGYLKTISPDNEAIVDEDDMETDTNITCLITFARVAQSEPCHVNCLPGDSHSVAVRKQQFLSRCNTYMEFTYVDQRVTEILGYLPHELLGTCLYDYVDHNDLKHTMAFYNQVLHRRTQCMESTPFHFKTQAGGCVQLTANSVRFQNPWTKDIEYIVTTNTVINNSQEVTKSEQVPVRDTVLRVLNTGIACDMQHNFDNVSSANLAYKSVHQYSIPRIRVDYHSLNNNVQSFSKSLMNADSTVRDFYGNTSNKILAPLLESESQICNTAIPMSHSCLPEELNKNMTDAVIWESRDQEQRNEDEDDHDEDDDCGMSAIMSLLEDNVEFGGVAGTGGCSDISWPYYDRDIIPLK